MKSDRLRQRETEMNVIGRCFRESHESTAAAAEISYTHRLLLLDVSVAGWTVGYRTGQDRTGQDRTIQDSTMKSAVMQTSAATDIIL
jgi:hypothetical protein